MILMFLRSCFFTSFLSSLFLFSSSLFAFAADDWCIENPAHPPCEGLPGNCTINSDGSLGGFVADTANVESTSICGFFSKNIPYLARYTQVCDSAVVAGNAQILEYAQVYGNARVFQNAIIFGHARIFENARVYGFAFVYENALVCENALVSGHAYVYGNARVSGDALVFQDARIQGNDILFGGLHRVHS